nr:helix-turn-helix domain-containing protein [Pantoea agglomerans]
MLACEQLNYSDQTIAQIAAASGYESESAFAKAFKQIIGCSPGRFAAKRIS